MGVCVGVVGASGPGAAGSGAGGPLDDQFSSLATVGIKTAKLNTTQTATETAIDSNEPKSEKMSSGTFVDRIDPFAKRSLKKKSKKSQGSSRYRNSQDVELQQLPPLKGDDFNYKHIIYIYVALLIIDHYIYILQPIALAWNRRSCLYGNCVSVAYHLTSWILLRT